MLPAPPARTAFWGAAPLKKAAPPAPPPRCPPRRPIRAEEFEPIKRRYRAPPPSGHAANQRLPPFSLRLKAPRARPQASWLHRKSRPLPFCPALPSPRETPSTTAPRPGEEPPLPCRNHRTLCQPSWSHIELCACAR